MHRLLLTIMLLSSLATQAANNNDPFAFELGTEEAGADLWDWDGYIDVRNRYASRHDDWLSNRLRLQLGVRYQGEGWNLFANGYADYDPAIEDYDNNHRAALHEAYAHFETAEFDLTLGKKRIAWGAADGRSSIDRINAVDLSDPIDNGRNLARLPSWLVAVERETRLGVWQAVWLPIGREQRLPRFGSPWESSALHALRQQAQSGYIDLEIKHPRQYEGGLRFTRYTPGLDWGLAVFDGYTDAPLLQQINARRVSLNPARVRTWNVNTALNLGKGTLRAELSLSPDYPVNGTRQPLTQLIIGWDKTHGGDIYLNLQGYLDHYDGVRKDYGMTFALSKPFLGHSLDAGIRGQLADSAQYALEIFADYTLDDQRSVHFKLMGFGGDQDSALGAYRNNDFAELTLRYNF